MKGGASASWWAEQGNYGGQPPSPDSSQHWARGRFRIQWIDGTVFKVEQEGDGLSDERMLSWGKWMDNELAQRAKCLKELREQDAEEESKEQEQQSFVASTLNFSRNDLGDEGIRSIVEYLKLRDISVLTVKLFKNNISDGGAWALGQLITHSPEVVQELHLSHNWITEQGACSVFESIMRSGRYPYQPPSSDPDKNPAQRAFPVWLRLEHNAIDWSHLQPRLEQQKLRWRTAENISDSYYFKAEDDDSDLPPVVCIHQSYLRQKSEGTDTSNSGGRASPGSPAARGAHQDPETQGAPASLSPSGDRENLLRSPPALPTSPGNESQPEETIEEIPMYIFIDASAIRRMMSPATSDASLFTFQGLINLCQQGHFKCTPLDDLEPDARYTGEAEEHDRIIIAITDSVLEELEELAERSPAERASFEWLRDSPDSYLKLCHAWGILEILETQLHTKLMKLTNEQEANARALGIAPRALKTIDFACLWESQIESEGRVLFVTANEAARRFSAECGSGMRLRVFHVDDLDRRFSEDVTRGGRRLCVASRRRPQAGMPGEFAGAVLSASLMSSILRIGRFAHLAGGSAPVRSSDLRFEKEAIRHELREALQLLHNSREHLGQIRQWADHKGSSDISCCLERMDGAQRRWQDLLSH